MAKRTFKHSRSSNVALASNFAHQKALDHALQIFDSDALYTMIPKNAFSTMRYSIALANGFIRHESGIDWIHQNNKSFAHSDRSGYRANFAFVIVRCPLSRICSAYMDKIVGGGIEAQVICETANFQPGKSNLSFKNFLKIIPLGRANSHWVPQSFFLLFDNYDEYFCFERFKKVTEKLKHRINLDVKDIRSILKHDNSRLNGRFIPNAWDVLPAQHLVNKSQGIRPNVENMFDEECVDICKKVYREDLELYREHFGKSDLMKRFGI